MHYNGVILSAMASQITVYARWRSKKHQSSATLAFVRELHRRPVNSPHKGPVTRKMFLFDDVIIVRDPTYIQCWFSYSLIQKLSFEKMPSKIQLGIWWSPLRQCLKCFTPFYRFFVSLMLGTYHCVFLKEIIMISKQYSNTQFCHILPCTCRQILFTIVQTMTVNCVRKPFLPCFNLYCVYI